MPLTAEKEFYTAEEIALILGISTDSVLRRIREGALGAHRIGGTYRVPRQEWKDYLRRTRTRSMPGDDTTGEAE